MVTPTVLGYAAEFNQNFVQAVTGSPANYERYNRLYARASDAQRYYLEEAQHARTIENPDIFSVEPTNYRETLRAAKAFAAVAQKETHFRAELEACLPRELRNFADVQRRAYPHIPEMCKLAGYEPNFAAWRERLMVRLFG